MSTSTQNNDTNNPIRVSVIYRVVQHWRIPVFKQISNNPKFDLTILHSKGIEGTKVVNGRDLSCLSTKVLPTIGLKIKSSGREAPIVICPSLLLELVRKKPSVILAEGGGNLFNNFSVFAYSKITNTPIVWWTLGEIPGRKYGRLGRCYRRIVLSMERNATALLGYSQVAIDYFIRNGAPAEKCFKAVNCVDTNHILSREKTETIEAEKLRENLSLQDSKVILFAGALIESKRIDRLIHAFSLAKKEYKNLKLVIVGKGQSKSSLFELCKNLSIESNVIFTGEVIDGIGPYFKAADLFVLPGLGGLAISEALAHSTPVICGQGDGCEVDLVENGSNGYRFSPHNKTEEEIISEISSLIKTCLQSDEHLKRLKHNAKETIIKKYNINSYTKEISKAIIYAHNKR